MSALTVSQDPEQSWDDLVRFWEEMEWPEGSKVEIIEGIITVSPLAAHRHNVHRGPHPASPVLRDPRGLGDLPDTGIAVPSRLGMFIPDLAGGPRAGVR